MWYINITMIRELGLDEESFILTMWYINIQGTINFVKKGIGFILTMWYINTLEEIIDEAERLVLY